jgi:DNA-binding LacI/PurR family transcriptional regulator
MTHRRPVVSRYRQVEQDIRGEIRSGRWPTGSMLPSRRDLARQYSVSLLTVSRAVEPMLADGTLRSDNRRGTFVAMPITSGGSADAIILPPSFGFHDGAFTGRHGTEIIHRPASHSPSWIGQKTIAVVTFFLSERHQEYVILHALEQTFASTGNAVQVVNRATPDGELLGLPDAVEIALESRPAGLIIIAMERDITSVEADLGNISLRNVPTVYILTGEVSRPIPYVFYDQRSSSYQAMQHMIGRGIKEFTVVAPFSASWVTERIAGIRAAATNAGMSPDTVRVMTGDGHPWTNWENPRTVAYAAAQVEMDAGWRPSGGLLCVSDGVALGVIDAAAERGLRPGRDFAILGFDDAYESRGIGLTSVRPPLTAMAREAACLLRDQWLGSDTSRQVRVCGHVIPRMSSGITRLEDGQVLR